MTWKIRIISPGCAVFFALVLGIPAQALAEEPPETVPGSDPDESLSEQLDQDKSVIKPPPVGDADIHVPAPNPDPGTTPVIPPSDIPDAGTAEPNGQTEQGAKK